MADKNDREFTRLLLSQLLMLVFFIGLFFVGTFHDEAIAKALYTPDNIVVKVLTSIFRLSSG